MTCLYFHNPLEAVAKNRNWESQDSAPPSAVHTWCSGTIASDLGFWQTGSDWSVLGTPNAGRPRRCIMWYVILQFSTGALFLRAAKMLSNQKIRVKVVWRERGENRTELLLLSSTSRGQGHHMNFHPQTLLLFGLWVYWNDQFKYIFLSLFFIDPLRSIFNWLSNKNADQAQCRKCHSVQRGLVPKIYVQKKIFGEQRLPAFNHFAVIFWAACSLFWELHLIWHHVML